jgi:hypothetical protein
LLRKLEDTQLGAMEKQVNGLQRKLNFQFLSTFGYVQGRMKLSNYLLIDWENFRLDRHVAQGLGDCKVVKNRN